MHDFRLPGLVTLGTIVLLFYVTAMVGRARMKYGIAAPATTGNADFELVFRVQMNTLENTMIFLPALWLFAAFSSSDWKSSRWSGVPETTPVTQVPQTPSSQDDAT